MLLLDSAARRLGLIDSAFLCSQALSTSDAKPCSGCLFSSLSSFMGLKQQTMRGCRGCCSPAVAYAYTTFTCPQAQHISASVPFCTASLNSHSMSVSAGGRKGRQCVIHAAVSGIESHVLCSASSPYCEVLVCLPSACGCNHPSHNSTVTLYIKREAYAFK